MLFLCLLTSILATVEKFYTTCNHIVFGLVSTMLYIYSLALYGWGTYFVVVGMCCWENAKYWAHVFSSDNFVVVDFERFLPKCMFILPKLLPISQNVCDN